MASQARHEPSGRLQGRVALITGSSRGIGAAIAKRLSLDGADVVINYVKAKGEAEAVASTARRNGGRAIVLQADVADHDQVTKLVHGAAAEMGRLDILVNNAVTVHMEPLGAIRPDVVRAQLATNIEGVIAAVQAAIPHLSKSSGRIINIGSLASTQALPATTVYSATKGAIDAMTRVWARELGPRGITVNTVAPGPVETDLMKANADDAIRASFVERTALGRIGQPADIADVVAFLASDDARWVTGQVIGVTGGFTPP